MHKKPDNPMLWQNYGKTNQAHGITITIWHPYYLFGPVSLHLNSCSTRGAHCFYTLDQLRCAPLPTPQSKRQDSWPKRQKGVKSLVLFYKLYYRDADDYEKKALKIIERHRGAWAVFAGATRQKEAPPAPVAIISVDRACRAGCISSELW